MYTIEVDQKLNVLYLRLRPPLSEEEQEYGIREFYRTLADRIRPGGIMVSDIVRDEQMKISVYDEVSARMCAGKIGLGIRIITDPSAAPGPESEPPTPYPVIYARDAEAAQKLIAIYRRDHPAD